MSETRRCPECGSSVGADAPRGLCPRCLMMAAVQGGESTELVGETPRRKRAISGKPKSSGEVLVDLERFRRAVFELGLITEEEWDLFGAFDSAAGVASLSQLLVQAGKLTPYQAAAIRQGKAKGLVIGEYIVRDRLGQGGMGVVFKARNRAGGRDVALKMLPPSFGRDRDAVRRFRREFEVASRLDHPNVVRVFDADEDRGVQFLTMAYIEGNDLHKLLTELGPLPVDLGLDCTIQAARGLAAAHAMGIVHRDVKPANLMLDRSGTVRVLDLGLARVVEASGPLGNSLAGGLTQTATLLGTVDFLAPEQADDSKRADHRADIYSLGCTLYFLLTGKPPFGGDSVIKKLIAHREIPAPSLKASLPDVFDALDAVCASMLAKNPADRPSTMAEVTRQLEACRVAPEVREGARPTLKGYSETMMKRAAAPRRRPNPNASVLDRRDRPGDLHFDPDLRIEDLVTDYRDVVPTKPIPEEKLPPIVHRIAKTVSPPRRSSAGASLGGLAALVIVVAAAGLFLTQILRSKPSREPITAPETSQAAVNVVEPSIVDPKHVPPRAEFVLIEGRPTLIADFREGPIADGKIGPNEYGPPVQVDFQNGSRLGEIELSKTLQKIPDDLSVEIRTAYSSRSLFMAFEVYDQFVDDQEVDKGQPFLNDCVEVFLDGDQADDDFSPKDTTESRGSKEGFQLLVDAGGNRLTVARDFKNEDWKGVARRTSSGYVVEFEIPLSLIDTGSWADFRPAGPGSMLHLALAIDESDETAPGKRSAFAFLRARKGIKSPFLGGESSWSLGILLKEHGTSVSAASKKLVSSTLLYSEPSRRVPSAF